MVEWSQRKCIGLPNPKLLKNKLWKLNFIEEFIYAESFNIETLSVMND
jgi:hypothetical protein